MSPELFRLPWEIQLTLASGFAAYVLSYVGIRAHHTTIDAIFCTLIFGLCAGLITGVMQPTFGSLIADISAFFGSCAVGLLWRRFGRKWLHAGLRRSDTSWSNDDTSALTTIINDTSSRLSMLSVRLDDDRWLECEDLSRFEHSPHGPCVLGPAGDFALYVTRVVKPDGTSEPAPGVTDEYWGDRLTYIPASKVKQVNLRYLKSTRFPKVLYSAASAEATAEQQVLEAET